MPDKKLTDNEIIKAWKVVRDRKRIPTEFLINETLDLINRQKEKYDHLLKVARKMHTWIFLNTGNEQAAYDEIGLSDKDNAMLGYGGEFEIVAKNDNLLKEMVGE